MTTFYLVRHAAHALVDDVLVGRNPIGLSGEGKAQARRLASHFATERIAALQSSPQVRASETATAIAERMALSVTVTAALDEVDLGAWSGRRFSELSADLSWQRWNARRGSGRAPGGESMQEVQRRIVDHMERCGQEDGDGGVIVVSHAEVIRAAILHALRLPLDDFHRIEVTPASITTIGLTAGTPNVLRVNELVPS